MTKSQERLINSYQVNKKSEVKTGDVFVILNVSHPQNVEALFEFAVLKADKKNKRIVCLYSDPESRLNKQNVKAMRDNLEEIKNRFRSSSLIKLELIISTKKPQFLIEEIALKPSIIICDTGRMNHEKFWRYRIARVAPCKLVRVEMKRDRSNFNLSKVLENVHADKISLEEIVHWSKEQEWLSA